MFSCIMHVLFIDIYMLYHIFRVGFCFLYTIGFRVLFLNIHGKQSCIRCVFLFVSIYDVCIVLCCFFFLSYKVFAGCQYFVCYHHMMRILSLCVFYLLTYMLSFHALLRVCLIIYVMCILYHMCFVC